MKRINKFIAISLCFLILITSLNFSSIEVNAATTTVDLTGLSAGSEVSHDCVNYLTSKYDSSQHWQECTLCGKIIGSKSNHSYSEYWTMGDSCSPQNKLIHSCSCGYSYQTENNREHNFSDYIQNICEYNSYQKCLTCNLTINSHSCYKEDGTRINCDNLGICSICGYNYTRRCDEIWEHNSHTSCNNCGKHIGELKQGYTKISDTKYILYFDFTADEWINIDNGVSIISGDYDTSLVKHSNLSYTIEDRTIHAQVEVTLSHIENFVTLGVLYIEALQKNNNDFWRVLYCPTISPDYIEPVVNNISQTDISTSNGWSTAKQITISGTENYCGSVKLTMKDSSGIVYLNNISVGVSNNAWSYSFIPDIEADANGKTFTVTATDTLGNSSSKTFTVYKTDKKPPVMTSATETAQTWSKTKDFTFTATDTGSGNVQIAFNNTNDYKTATQSGTSYSRDYTFTGDVYGNVTAAVYFKDAVGNETTKFIKIYNLDNTKPTITNASVTAGKGTASIVVTANDINTTLNASGSGVSGYGISTSASTQPTNWQTSNVLTVSKNGVYYVWTKDAVGNISTPYTITIKNITVDVVGTVTWKDNNDSLGYRPKTVDIILKRNGKEIQRKTLTNSDTSFSFTSLPQTDNSYNLYTYTVEQEFTAKYLINENGIYKEKDAYSTSISNTNFTNTIIEPDSPIVPVKPEHKNTLTIKTNHETQVILKQMESVISNGKVSYTDNYNGFIYNAIIDGNLILSAIPSGKYEVIILNNEYETIDVSLSNAVNTSYDGKYLIISDTNTDNSGTLNISLDNLKNHRGYQKEYNKNNYWKLQ